jgi:hypothetical protein
LADERVQAPCLVLLPRDTPLTQSMRRAALAGGWRVHRLTSGRVTQPPDGPLVVYGEPMFAVGSVADQLGLTLIAPDRLWLARLPSRWTQRLVNVARLEDAQALTVRRFVKPAYARWFKAAIYEPGEMHDIDAYADTIVLISEPVIFEVEYRYFVADRRVHAGSIYMRDGDLADGDDESWSAPTDEAAEARAFIDALLLDPDVDVPAALVIEVGRLDTGAWAVIRARPAWATGLCGADPRAVLPVLLRASHA